MWTKPPGDANALTPSVSSTMNVHGSFGPLGLLCQHGADQRHVLVDRGSCTTPNRWRIFSADVSAELDLFLLGDVQVVELLLLLLRLLRLAHEAAELRVGRAS